MALFGKKNKETKPSTMKIDVSKRQKNKDGKMTFTEDSINANMGKSLYSEGQASDEFSSLGGGLKQDAVDRLVSREKAAKNNSKNARSASQRKNELAETEAREQRKAAERRAAETPRGEGFVKR